MGDHEWRYEGNEEGKWTYSGRTSESLIDYVIGRAGGRDRVNRLVVEDNIDSDHYPVVV